MGTTPPCPTPLRSRVRQFGPQIAFVTVSGRPVGGADADFPVQLPFPCTKIFITSMLTVVNSVYFHFKQLNKNYTGNAIAPNGAENWIPMTNFIVNTAAPWYWTVLQFDDPIDFFYLDMGHENGAANTITFCCVAPENGMSVYGGPWT